MTKVFSLRELVEAHREALLASAAADDKARLAGLARVIAQDELHERHARFGAAVAEASVALAADKAAQVKRGELVSSLHQSLSNCRVEIEGYKQQARRQAETLTHLRAENEQLRAAIETHRGTIKLQQAKIDGAEAADHYVITLVSENVRCITGVVVYDAWHGISAPLDVVLGPGERLALTVLKAAKIDDAPNGTPVPQFIDGPVTVEEAIIHKEPSRFPDGKWVDEAGEVWDIWLKTGK